MSWPPEFRKLADGLGPDSPVLRMGVPHSSEDLPDPDGLSDPTGDCRLRPLPFVVRKHSNRVVVLATSKCFFYCRFCFRRDQGTPVQAGLQAAEWGATVRWLAKHREIEEVILSGGDPLTLPDGHLARIGRALAGIDHLKRWRIHTRAPVVLPSRVTQTLVEVLHTPLPLRVVVHANHPAEVRPAFIRAVRALQRQGIEVFCQSVLLAGVNDRASVLAELFGRLAQAGVRPHYLHHPDRVPGNARFRLPIRRGLRIYRELLHRPLRLADKCCVPPYVVDLPNGAGKCPVEDLAPIAEERTSVRRRIRYRWVRPVEWDAVVADRRYEWWDVWEPDNSPGIRSEADARML